MKTMSKRITVTLTEDQADLILTLLGKKWHDDYFLDANEEYRKRGKELAAFTKRIMTLITVALQS